MDKCWEEWVGIKRRKERERNRKGNGDEEEELWGEEGRGKRNGGAVRAKVPAQYPTASCSLSRCY